MTSKSGTDAKANVLRVGQDLDGVWYPFDVEFTNYLLSTGFDASKVVEVLRYDFYKAYGLTTLEFLAHCHAGVDAGAIFAVGEPYAGALDAAKRIKDAGCDIHVITDRSFGQDNASQKATHAWLDSEGFPFDSVTISADKTVVEVDYFLEDKIENYDALDAAGVIVYLINRPWNIIEGGDDRRRVNTHDEFADVVIAAQKIL